MGKIDEIFKIETYKNKEEIISILRANMQDCESASSSNDIAESGRYFAGTIQNKSIVMKRNLNCPNGFIPLIEIEIKENENLNTIWVTVNPSSSFAIIGLITVFAFMISVFTTLENEKFVFFNVPLSLILLVITLIIEAVWVVQLVIESRKVKKKLKELFN